MGIWGSMLWELKHETHMPESHDLSSSYPTPLSYGWASHTPTNHWSLCEAHRCGSSNSCARRSLRCCLKANPNPSDTPVSCHFSHEFRNSFWYGGLLRIATEQSTYLLWSSCHCLSLSSVVCFRHLSLLQDGPAPLTHSICCFSQYQLTQEIPNKADKESVSKNCSLKNFLSIAYKILFSSFPHTSSKNDRMHEALGLSFNSKFFSTKFQARPDTDIFCSPQLWTTNLVSLTFTVKNLPAVSVPNPPPYRTWYMPGTDFSPVNIFPYQ